MGNKNNGGGRGAASYALHFPRLDEGLSTENTLTGEATPSYILRIDGPTMMEAVLPHAKLLLILRNPVSRAYSEYQMKFRRVVRLFDPHEYVVPLASLPASLLPITTSSCC
jgi:hypothetical protein